MDCFTTTPSFEALTHLPRQDRLMIDRHLTDALQVRPLTTAALYADRGRFAGSGVNGPEIDGHMEGYGKLNDRKEPSHSLFFGTVARVCFISMVVVVFLHDDQHVLLLS